MKSKLEKFIKKYTLNNEVEGAIVEYKESSLFTNFKNITSDVVGFVKVNGFDIDNERLTFGLHNNGVVLRMLKLFGDEIKINFDVQGDFVSTMNLIDANMDGSVLLADVNILQDQKPPPLNNLPDMDMENIELSSDILRRIIKAINAIKESELVAFQCRGGKLYFVVNYSLQHDTDKLVFDLQDGIGYEDFILPLNASVLKEVIDSNLDANICKLDIAMNDMVCFTFKGNDFGSKYYIIKSS